METVLESLIPCYCVIIEYISEEFDRIENNLRMCYQILQCKLQNIVWSKIKRIPTDTYVTRSLLILGLLIKYFDISTHCPTFSFEIQTETGAYFTFAIFSNNKKIKK